MKKEMIFMGKSDGVVRLALFDPNDGGVTRKLPVKEVSEDVFVSGIKSGKLPVRGFSVSGGRVVSEFGNWYKMDDVLERNAFSLFGTVYFGGGEAVTLNYKKVGYSFSALDGDEKLYLGIASIEWRTGMFRVMSAVTASFMIRNHTEHIYYIYGDLFKKTALTYGFLSIREKNGEEVKEGEGSKESDYVFKECECTESVDDIAKWVGVASISWLPLYQQFYQRCEHTYVTISSYLYHRNRHRNNDLLKDADVSLNAAFILFGTSPLQTLELPSGVGEISCVHKRSVERFNIHGRFWCKLNRFIDGFEVQCDKLETLELDGYKNSKAKIIHTANDSELTVRYWNGYDGCTDYTGLGIKRLEYCFVDVANASVRVDADIVENSFSKFAGNEVEFTKAVLTLHNSFRHFSGELRWHGAGKVTSSFCDCDFTKPLDLRESNRISSSMSRVTGNLLLPDEFVLLEHDMFRGTPLSAPVKLRPERCETKVYDYDKKLSVDLYLDHFDGYNHTLHEVSLGNMNVYLGDGTTHLPKFDDSMLPSNTITGTYEAQEGTFQNLKTSVLDLRRFGTIKHVPEGMALRCNFTTVIFADGTETIGSKVFKECGEIQHIYIPSSVKSIGSLVFRERIKYTIYTQKGSAADKFANSKGIDVRYVDDVNGFESAINEIPAEFEGAVAVATFTGKKDAEETVALMACESVALDSELYTRFPIKENCNLQLGDLAWVRSGGSTYSTDGFLAARMHVLGSFLSQHAPLDMNVAKITMGMSDYRHGKFSFGEYNAHFCKLNTGNGPHVMVWALARGDTVVHMFTEKVQTYNKPLSVYKLFEDMRDIDSRGGLPTQYGNAMPFTTFTGSWSAPRVQNARLSYTAGDTVLRAIRNTFVPVGVYQVKQGKRIVACLNVVDGSCWGITVSAGKSFDKDGRNTGGVWTHIEGKCGQAYSMESLPDVIMRVYNELDGARKLIGTLLGETTDKVSSYDLSLPESEIDAFRTILKIYGDDFSDYNQRVNQRTPTELQVGMSVQELKSALSGSGIVRTLSEKAFAAVNRNTYLDKIFEVHLTDGICYIKKSYYVTYFDFGDGKVYVVALSVDELFPTLSKIIGLYGGLQTMEPAGVEQHWSHVDRLLPYDEFICFRRFRSGGSISYGSYGDSNPGLLVSKVSGKPCVAATFNNGVVPLFWVNTFSDAFKLFEKCGLMAFKHNSEWSHKRFGYSLCGSVFDSKEEYEDGIPSFRHFYTPWRHVRVDLQKGEGNGHTCVLGDQGVFDLCMKHPPLPEHLKSEMVTV